MADKTAAKEEVARLPLRNFGAKSAQRLQGEGMQEEELTAQIIGAAIDVHKHWGPGLYEDIYQRSMCRELALRQIPFEGQVSVPLVYKGERVGDDLRPDLIVDHRVIVELKTVNELLPVHDAQLLTYMKLTQCHVGLLINFNVAVLKQGIKRMVL